MMDKPLPCPFCSGTARWSIDTNPTPIRYMLGCSRCIIATEWATEAEAIAAWNTRADTSEIERLRAVVDGAAEERARIVAWLRKPVTIGEPWLRPFAELTRNMLADAIERGDHLALAKAEG